MARILVVGLGNPGPQYRSTRHNFGWLALEITSFVWGIPLCRHDLEARWGVGRLRGAEVILAQPQTFMNESGRAVLLLNQQLAPHQLVVVHDDVDLPLGRLRIKWGGGDGGHLGVRSIIQAVGPDFWRVRLGIGRPPPSVNTAQWVLAPFEPSELPRVEETTRRALEALECLLTEGPQRAMTRFNA